MKKILRFIVISFFRNILQLNGCFINFPVVVNISNAGREIVPKSILMSNDG